MNGLRPEGRGLVLMGAVTVVAATGLAGLAYLAGEALASISLIFGVLFFLFAARYYVAILAVLLSPSVSAVNGRNSADQPQDGNGNGSYPMISVHLAIYNEERVTDRLLTACSKLDYPNYEVVVVDDSKDGTVKILKEWILKQMQSTLPRIKIVHRYNREGFKGGALNEALRKTNPKAEFVVVFDADFVPPPDILKKFLAYFNRHSNGGNGNGLSNGSARYSNGKLAAVQGYQWHTLNRSENWLTRGITCEFAGSYMVDRTFQEVAGTLKMVAGSVYMVRADLLRKYGWSNSITEDWELTLRLYEAGHRVLYTPLIQAPGECPSNLGKLVKQRMRWAEGHTFNVKRHFLRVLSSKNIGLKEKLEFLYFAPYYLQSVFLILGTLFWFTSDALLGTKLPFWTSTFGWALVFTNLLALPLMSLTGLFFERRARKDFPGLFSQFLLIYALAPYQAYAAIKGLVEPAEGSWVRTFKSGRLAGFPGRLEPRKVLKNVLPPKRGPSKSIKIPALLGLGLAILLVGAFATGADTSGGSQPSYYFYNQAAPSAYSAYPNTLPGFSFLMHTSPPYGQESSAAIGSSQGSGPLFYSDAAPADTSLPYGASVSVHLWVNATWGNWTTGATGSSPQWHTTTTQTAPPGGTLEFRIDLYNPANDSVAEIPGASETGTLELQPGLNFYEMSWGSIGPNAIVPKGDVILVTIWCSECASSPTLQFNSALHESSIDFPIIVPEDSLPFASIALILPMTAGLVLDFKRGQTRGKKEGDRAEAHLHNVQLSLIAAAAVILLTIPLVITFSSLLTSIATATGFDRVVSSIVPYEAAAVADLLRGFGLPAGNNASSVWLAGGFVPVVAFIDWNCAGWQGFALFGITAVGGIGEIGSRGRQVVVVIAGVTGVFAVNVLRIFFVVLIGYSLGYPAATVFHDYGGTILTLAWLLGFWALVFRHRLDSAAPSVMTGAEIEMATP